MIDIIDKKEKAILVCRIDEMNLESKEMMLFTKPQVIHMSVYDFHLLFTQINITTLLYYIERFHIDYFALNIPLTKFIKPSQHIINQVKISNPKVIIICTGEAITSQIAKDIGTDGYTLNGADLMRVIELIEYKNKNKTSQE